MSCVAGLLGCLMPMRNDAGRGVGVPSAASTVLMDDMKPALDSKEESCSTCDTQSNLSISFMPRRQMSTLPAMGVMTAYRFSGSHDSGSGSSSPRSQLDDATTSLA